LTSRATSQFVSCYSTSKSTSSSSVPSSTSGRTKASTAKIKKDESTNNDYDSWGVVTQIREDARAMILEQRYQYLSTARHLILSRMNNKDTDKNPLAIEQLSQNIIAYNVHRAFVINLEIMGFDHKSICDEHTISPFVKMIGAPKESDNLNLSTYPKDLLPTVEQQTTSHHPFWDCFPNPEFRQMVMGLKGQFNHWQLIADLTGASKDVTNTSNAVILWGEPYMQSSWEITEIFFKKYPVLAVRCKTLIQSSNYWRESRGEPPLRIEELE